MLPSDIEFHGDERAGLFVGYEPFDGKLGIDQESRAFVGDDDFVAPRQDAAERAVDFGRQPFGVADVGSVPVGELLDARAPGGVGGKAFERAALLLDDDAGDEAGGAGVGVGGLDGDDVVAGREQLGNVVDVHLAPVGAAASELAVDIQFVLVVAGDVDLAQLGLSPSGERLAEVAVADGHLVFFVRRRPDPIRADELEECGPRFGVGLLEHRLGEPLRCGRGRRSIALGRVRFDAGRQRARRRSLVRFLCRAGTDAVRPLALSGSLSVGIYAHNKARQQNDRQPNALKPHGYLDDEVKRTQRFGAAA